MIGKLCHRVEIGITDVCRTCNASLKLSPCLKSILEEHYTVTKDSQSPSDYQIHVTPVRINERNRERTLKRERDRMRKREKRETKRKGENEPMRLNV